jgi:hypothetical protein
MSENRKIIKISPTEIETLYQWINSLDPKPHVVELIATATGIGTHIRVEYETSESEGRFKDITDYDNW